MEKRTYARPALSTRRIELGVFGSYGGGGGDDDGGCGGTRRHRRHRRGGWWGWGWWQEALPAPVATVHNLDLRLK